MKTRICSLLVLATSLVSFAAAAAPAKQAFIHPVVSVERYGQTLAARGTSMHAVERALGKPPRQLGSDVWIYFNFHAGIDQSPNDDCHTLMITFTEGRVSDLKLVNDRAEKVIAAMLTAKSLEKAQVAAK